MSSDPWSSLQAPGAVATDGMPAGTTLAYSDIMANGRHLVGFDLAMTLPRRCFTCAGTDALEDVRLKFRLQTDRIAQALSVMSGEGHGVGKVGPGRYYLDLPHCSSCARNRKRAMVLALVAQFFPIVVIGLTVAAAAIATVAALPALLVSVAAWVFVAIKARGLRRAAWAEIERVDGDGIARVVGVHPDTAQAIVDAATGGSR